jgi:diguanylate cyclase (GGDEF)-like protein
MRFLSAESSQAFMRRVILPLAALVIGLLLLAIGGMFWVAGYQTQIATEQQARLADGAFRIEAEKLATSAADYGYWDDAVTAIVDKPDPAWMNENIGSGAEKSFGVKMSFALDPDGKPVYSFVNGAAGRQDPATLLGSGFRTVFAAWKRRPADQAYSALLPYNGTAVAIAFAPVRSFTHPERKPTGYAVVFVKLIDAALLQKVAHDFELADFRVVKSKSDIADPLAVVKVADAADKSKTARFAWDPQRPGADLLKIVLPFMGIFLIMLMLLVAVVFRYVIASAQLIRDRERQASCDPLTGLANRTRFFAELDMAIRGIAPGQTGVTVMYVDLDGFKAINDTLGHAAGDELLQQASQRFRACVRETDLVARLGGDEFAIILSGKSDKSQIQAVGARILLALAEPFHLAIGTAHSGCSIGIADCRDNVACSADLLNRADRALYEAKASGKNALRFSGDMQIAKPDLRVA